MDVFPTVSVFETPKIEMHPDTVDTLATTYSLAQGNPSDENYNRNAYRVQNGEADTVEDEITVQRNSDLPQVKYKLLDSFLKEGQVDYAQLAINGIPPASKDAAVGEAAAENAIAPTLDDTQVSEYLPNLNSDINTNAKLVILNNGFAKLMKTSSEKYDYISPSEQDAITINQEAGLPAPMPRGIGNMLLDFLGSMVNWDYAAGKANSDTPYMFPVEFMLPASTSKVTAEALRDPSIPPEQFANIFNESLAQYQQAFEQNPMKAFSAMLDAVFMGGVNSREEKTYDPDGNLLSTTIVKEADPVLERWRSISQFVTKNPETGEYNIQPNIVAELFDPKSKLDQFMYNTGVQNVLQNPYLDYAWVKQLKTIGMMRNLAGRQGTAKLLNNLERENESIVQHFFDTQLQNPNGLANATDPYLVAEFQKQKDIAEEALKAMAVPQRVAPSPEAIQGVKDQLTQNMFPEIAPTGANLTGPVLPSTRLTRPNLAWMEPEHDMGNNFMGVFIQSEAGAPFADPKLAVRYADKLGLTNYTIHNQGSQYFIKVKHAISDTTFLDNSIPTEFYNTKGMRNNWLKFTRPMRWALTPLSTAPVGSIARGSAANQEVSKLAHSFNKLNQTLLSLNGEERNAVQSVLLNGMLESNPRAGLPNATGKWFNPQELRQQFIQTHNRLPTPKEEAGYYAIKQSNDLAYVLHNKRVRDDLAAGGYNHWMLDDSGWDQPVLAKEWGPVVPPDAKVLLPNGDVKSWKELPPMARDGNVVLKFEGAIENNNREVHFALWPQGSAKSTGLSDSILGYVEGGAREYTAPWFIKQKRTGRIPSTLAAHETPAAANAYAARLEAIKGKLKEYRQGLKGNLTPQDRMQLAMRIDADIQAIDQGWSLQKIQDSVISGEIDLDHKVIVRYDREPMPEAQNFGGGSVTEMHQINGRLYTSPRGTHLPDEHGNPANLVHPFASLARQQGAAARVAGFGNFSLKEQYQWAAQYGKYVTLPEGMAHTPENVFKYGEFPRTPGTVEDFLSRDIVNRAEAHRVYVQRVLRMETPIGASMREERSSAAKWMAETFGDKAWLQSGEMNFAKAMGQNTAPEQDFWDALRTGRIVSEAQAENFLKGMSYDLHLGGLNPAQFWVQATGAIIPVSMYPKYGAKAMEMYLPLRTAAMFDFDGHMVKALATRATRQGHNDFYEMVSDYKLTGLNNVASTDTMRDLSNSVDPVTGAHVGSIRDATRFFLYEGDRVSRGMAFIVARERALEMAQAGEFQKGSAAYINFIQGESNRLQMFMMAGGESAWNRSAVPFVNLAMQMKGYGIKMTELFLGVNQSLSKQERRRVLITQAALFGAFGVAAGPEMLDYLGKRIEKATGEKMDHETLRLAMYGMTDVILKEAFGIEGTAASSRSGYGDTPSQLYKMFTENPFLATMFGIVGTDLEKMKNFSNELKLLASVAVTNKGEYADPVALSEQGLRTIGQLFSGSTQYSKAFLLNQTGQLMNSRGTTVIEYNSQYSALALAVGIPPEYEQMQYKLLSIDKSRKAVVKDFATQVAALRQRSIAGEVTNSPDSLRVAKQAQDTLNILRAIYGADPQMERDVDRMATEMMSNNINENNRLLDQAYFETGTQ